MNNEFVSKFIQECATDGLTSPKEICKEARARIAKIDEQVKYRIHLSDVLEIFKEQDEVISENVRLTNKSNNIDKKLASDVLELIGNRKIPINGLSKFFDKFSDEYKRNIIYTTKCMIENNILSRDSDSFIAIGDRYYDYLKSQNVVI